MSALFKARFQGYNGKELVTWITIAIVSAYTFVNTTGGIVHATSWLLMLIFFNLAMGNVFYPRLEGYIFWPISRWWRRNCRKLDSYPVDGVWYYSSLCDIRTWTLYDRDGYHVGWHGESHYDGEQFVKWESSGSRLPWMVRWRSGKLPAGCYADVIGSDGVSVRQTPYKVN